MYLRTCGSFKSGNHKWLGSANCKSENLTNYLSCGFTVCGIYLQTAHLFVLISREYLTARDIIIVNCISLKELQKLDISDMVV
jgi:hypothetical protein